MDGSYRRVVLTSGHLIDSVDRAAPRFPPCLEPIVANEIETMLDRWAIGPLDLVLNGAARGADILFAESAHRRGAGLEFVLASLPDQFERTSVALPRSIWPKGSVTCSASTRTGLCPRPWALCPVTSTPGPTLSCSDRLRSCARQASCTWAWSGTSSRPKAKEGPRTSWPWRPRPARRSRSSTQPSFKSPGNVPSSRPALSGTLAGASPPRGEHEQKTVL